MGKITVGLMVMDEECLHRAVGDERTGFRHEDGDAGIKLAS